MVPLNTATVGLAVTPSVISTLVAHFLDRKPRAQRPTAHLSYDEGLHLIRAFLDFASHHTIEELQAFTSQWVPHPQWVKVDEVTVPQAQLTEAASVLEAQLGPEGVRAVGGRKWWQRGNGDDAHGDHMKAEWIEMRSDYHERKASKDPGRRVMFYIHGGAYFFGSVDEHRYQLQRHARKLKARLFAPKYRLAPQDPFPCGLVDCLAAYMYLLTVQDPSTIVLAGDSAGGGMVLSILVMLRDQGLPLPAGAVLISPWVDLTHSFPSVAEETRFDYIPQGGFHYKPSVAWPPPSQKELDEMKKIALQQKKKATDIPSKGRNDGSQESEEPKPTTTDIADASTCLKLVVDNKTVELQEQIQMYTTNELLSHPLVSPVLQPTLGGLPPLLIMVGGGEVLRDEQIYTAHKAANPKKYPPGETLLTEKALAQIEQYKPTDVQVQVWDDLCHVAPTLSFTRPAKYMYRSVAQFSAWALARAQNTAIEIMDDDQVSVISTDSSGDDALDTKRAGKAEARNEVVNGSVGVAGDPLPPFVGHMIRQRVTRHGDVFPLEPAAQLPGCTMDANLVGVVKQGPVKRWLAQKQQWDSRFAGTKKKVQKQLIKEIAKGYDGFAEGEFPPPTAVASRRKGARKAAERHQKKKRSMGLAMWSGWGSKHDEMTVKREQELNKEPDTTTVTKAEGQNARPFHEIQNQEPTAAALKVASRSRSRTKSVTDEHQTDGDNEPEVDENTPIARILELRRDGAGAARPASGRSSTSRKPSHLTPDYHPSTTIGASGKRPYVDGIAVPFRLNKDAETASMMTLTSTVDQVTPMRESQEFFTSAGDKPATGALSTRPVATTVTATGTAAAGGTAAAAKEAPRAGVTEPEQIHHVNKSNHAVADEEEDGDVTPTAERPGFVAAPTPLETPGFDNFVTPMERPGMETFVTATEDLPTIANASKIG